MAANNLIKIRSSMSPFERYVAASDISLKREHRGSDFIKIGQQKKMTTVIFGL